ncbi:twin-arginine translocation signal domain-containing protein [Candidatus Saccharibacteria bacterium]|nr:twin-arginine translocation signal domain-containing protein [Candidatus Saccharibacteria bacterium]
MSVQTTRKALQMYMPDMSRRNFFKTAAVGVGAVALSSLPGNAFAQDVVVGKPFTGPFASFPFRRRDSLGLKITNGWTLSTDEAWVIGETEPGDHAAVDFEGPALGSDVLAPFDGYAIRSAQFGITNFETRFDPANPVQAGRMWKDPFTGREGYLGYGGLLKCRIHRRAILPRRFDRPVTSIHSTRAGSNRADRNG